MESISLFRWQYEAFLQSKEKFNAIPAGRRTGKTQGAERAAIITTAQGDKSLWVDTINGNIDRYYERYFLPDLRKTNLDYDWNAQKKILKIEDGYIDFRSADRPESIEGFGYDKIWLNEAGIILNNEYLYTNSILPMLMDYDNSQLFAFGTPKGKVNKKGDPHRFWVLWQKVLDGHPGYAGVQLSSYDNPILSRENIQELEKEIGAISAEAVQQEVYGQFIDASEERVFNHNDFDYFALSDLNREAVEVSIGAIDVADEGLDYYSFPMGVVIGEKFFVTDWLFTRENTNYTIPASTEKARLHKLDYLAVETNNHGSVVYKQINNELNGTTLIGIHQHTKKHSRVILSAGFLRDYFVFRNDYEVGSDYDKAMKQLFSYTKDGKAPHDDAVDSIALLSGVARDLLQDRWV
jgi:predicted phage terminase large subunit-like protein